MLHARNNTILFLWDKMFILMQNIFIVPGMQHGRRAKPLLISKATSLPDNDSSPVSENSYNNSVIRYAFLMISIEYGCKFASECGLALTNDLRKRPTLGILISTPTL